MFALLAPIILPVFISVGIGYGLQRYGFEFPNKFIADITAYVLVPCLVIYSLAGLDISLAAFAEVAGATFLAIGAFIIFGALALLVLRYPLRAFLPPIMIPNAGNLGLPLALFAFGEPGLALAVASYAIYALAQYTLAQVIAAGSFSLKLVARQPVIYAVLISLGFLITDTQPPQWILNTVQLVGGAAIPLSLLSLGAALAGLEVSTFGRSLYVAILRLGGGIAVGWAVAEILGLDGLTRGVVILQAAGPASLFSYMWARLYDNAPEQVAGVVMISTLISIFTLPVLLLMLL